MSVKGYHVKSLGAKLNVTATKQGTINAATTTEISMGSVVVGHQYSLCNDSALTMSIALNASNNPAFPLTGGDILSNDGIIFESVWLKNATTTSIDYRMLIQGT